MEKPLPELSIFVFKVNKLLDVKYAEKLEILLIHFCTSIVDVDANLEKKTVTIRGSLGIVKLMKIFKKLKIHAELIYSKKGEDDDDQRREEDRDKRENGCFCDSDDAEVDDIGVNHYKNYDQRKESWGKKEKERSCDNDGVEDIGADHYKKRNVFKDHKPEAYVPPKDEQFWGDHYEKRNTFKDHKPEAYVPPKHEQFWGDQYEKRNTFKDHKPEPYVPPKNEQFWGDVRFGMHKKYPMIPRADSWFTAGFSNYPGLYYPAPWQ